MNPFAMPRTSSWFVKTRAIAACSTRGQQLKPARTVYISVKSTAHSGEAVSDEEGALLSWTPPAHEAADRNSVLDVLCRVKDKYAGASFDSPHCIYDVTLLIACIVRLVTFALRVLTPHFKSIASVSWRGDSSTSLRGCTWRWRQL